MKYPLLSVVIGFLVMVSSLLLVGSPQADVSSDEARLNNADAFQAMAIAFTGNQAADARVVLSGAAPVPWRSAEAAVKNAEPMEQNECKIPLFRGLIEQELMAIAQPGSR